MQQARKLYSTGGHLPSVYPAGRPYAAPEPGRKARKVKLLLVTITAFLLCLVVVAQYSSLVLLNYRLSAARTELLKINEDSRLLELEVARLSSIGRIDTIARGELGMVDPELEQLRVLKVSQNGSEGSGE